MLSFRPFQTSLVWKFPDPDNPHHLHSGRTRAELIQAIVAYRSQNGLPTLHALDMVLDNYLCSCPENIGKCRPIPLRRGLMPYLKGGLTLLSNIWYGDKNMVTQEEADRRAAICAACPMNQFPDKEGFVLWSDDIMENSVGDKRTKYNDKLGSCIVCSCTLKALTWYKGALIKDKLERESYPDFCWKIQDEVGQKKK